MKPTPTTHTQDYLKPNTPEESRNKQRVRQLKQLSYNSLINPNWYNLINLINTTK